MFESMSDSEKVLAFIDIASSKSIKIEEEFIDSYIFLLKSKEEIPFDYTFIFHPLPNSRELQEDILGLKMAGYIKAASLIVTPKGKDWIRGRQAVLTDFKDLIDKIMDFVSDFKLLDRASISDAIYARIA